jgi:cytochrome c oxidase subunit 2
MKGRAEGGARISAMKGRHSPWVGVGLVIIGLLGLAVVVPLLLGNGTQYGGSWFGLGQRTFSSPGERLFLTGRDANGIGVPRSNRSMTGMMVTGGGCAACHGPDGRGRTVGAMMGSFEAPDIRWSTLSSPQDPQGRPQTPFDEAVFAHAVRAGVDPEGRRLKPPMPRWQVTDQEVQDLVAYLKTL